MKTIYVGKEGSGITKSGERYDTWGS